MHIRYFALLGAVLSACACFAGIENLKAYRRTLETGVVEIEFTLSGCEADAAYALKLTAEGGGKLVRASSFLNEPIIRAGRNRIVWDFGRDCPGMDALGCNITLAALPFTADTPLYCVIDVFGGAEAESYPVRYTHCAPVHVRGAVDEPCQTSEIWFRRIPAGKFRFGGSRQAGNFEVSLTNDFYMSVFETTQRQYFNLTGKWPSRFSNETCRASRPVDSVVMGDLRAWRWPDAAAVDPGGKTPIGILRRKSSIATIDLPTEAQWEYCAQDGGFGEKDWYRPGNRPLEEIARFEKNNGGWKKSDGTATDLSKGTAAVGSYAPNRWGLYDLIGNVEELCLDAVIDKANDRTKLKEHYESCGNMPAVEPTGPGYVKYWRRACRGGRFNQNGACNSFYRYGNDWNRGDMTGFRLAFTCAKAKTVPTGGGEKVVSKTVRIGREKPAFEIIPASGSAAVTLTDSAEEFRAAFVERDFEVDGTFARDTWKAAEALPHFVTCSDGSAFAYRGTVKVLYSRGFLYVGGELFQPMASAHVQYDQWHQPIWEDDNVELSLNLPVDGIAQPYHYVINPLGSVADLMNGNREYWTRELKAKACRHDDRWTFEMRIPFAGVPMERPVPGDSIGIRVCRTVHRPKKAVGSIPRMAAYAKGPLATYAKAETFAKLVFSEPKGPNAAKLMAEASGYRRAVFRETLRSRLDDARCRFAELDGGAAQFARDKHPLFMKAKAGLCQMRGELEEFEAKYGETVRRCGDVPDKCARRFLGLVEGFGKFASDNAYFVWQADPWTKGSPRSRPPADAAKMPGRIAFEQASNEREAVCLELAGALTGGGLDVRIVPYSVSKGGTFISSDNFEVYSEPFIRFEGDVMTAPLVRVPGNMVSLVPGEVKRVWIMFNSRGVKPGEYSTKILLKAASDARVKDREIPVSVKVWEFGLPETKDWPLPSFLWGPNLFRHDEVALLRLTHSYHITHGWTKGRQYWYGLKNDQNMVWPSKAMSERGFDEKLARYENEEFFRVAKELDMKFVFGWNIPAKLEWYKLMTERMRSMGLRDDQFIFKGLIRDEFMARHIPLSAKAREAVWNYSTNLWFQAVLLSTPPPTGPSLEQIRDAKLPEFYKMWTVIHGLLKDPVRGPETVRTLKSHGAEVWSYQCQRYMQRRNLLGYLRFYPWECYLMKLDGMALYTMFTPEGEDGWDSRDGYDEGLCWRGNDKKPVPTKRLEALREGLEDVAYMNRLEKELARLKAQGMTFAQYEKLLAERKAVIKSLSQKKVDEWRLMTGRAIDDLVRKGK